MKISVKFLQDWLYGYALVCLGVVIASYRHIDDPTVWAEVGGLTLVAAMFLTVLRE